MKKEKKFCPNKISSYFRVEWLTLLFVTISGLLYNAGLIATPYLEGQLAQCLADILGGNKVFADMAALVVFYIVVIFIVQAARFIKRFYVRRFANDVHRRMKGVLYANLIRKSRAEQIKEGVGEMMTKAGSDGEGW